MNIQTNYWSGYNLIYNPITIGYNYLINTVQSNNYWIQLLNIRSNNYCIQLLDIQSNNYWIKLLDIQSNNYWIKLPEIQSNNYWIKLLEIQSNNYWIQLDNIIPVMPTLPLLAGDLRFFASSPALPLWYINLPLFTSAINT